ncbi:MAG: hypothetical protein ACYCPO_01925, partial [Acidobacteriaceae bacterium]
VSDEERARAERVAAVFSEEDLTRFLNSMLRTFDDLGYRQEQRFHLELGLLKLVHMQRLLPLEDLFRQLSLPPGAGGSPGNATPRLTGAGATPRQLETSTPRADASIAAGIAQARQAVREENKQPAPAHSESGRMDDPVTAETHPLQGIFGPSSGSTIIQAAAPGSRPANVPAVFSSQPGSVSSSKLDATPAEPIDTRATVPPAATVSAGLPAVAQPEAASAQVRSALSQTSAPAAATTTPEAGPAPDVEPLRAAMSQALVRGGHETAGYLLEAGNYEWNGNELRVRVGTSKTLFEMTYPAQAQQIVREAFRQIAGPGRTVRLEPGDPSPANGKKTRAKAVPAPVTDGETRPQDHPLIRHALQLFSAEVRSVVSLRDPQAPKSQPERAPDGHGQN